MAAEISNDSLHNEEFGGKQTTLHDEVLVNPELMSDAFMAENREHEMGLWVSWRDGMDVHGRCNAYFLSASNEGAPNGLFLGLHDVFHYRKSCNLYRRIGQAVLTLYPTGHGVLLHVLER